MKLDHIKYTTDHLSIYQVLTSKEIEEEEVMHTGSKIIQMNLIASSEARRVCRQLFIFGKLL